MMKQLDSFTFFQDSWHSDNIGVIGPLSHASWLGGVVWDGARAFEGCIPDLQGHLDRLQKSCSALGYPSPVDTGTLSGIVSEGIDKFSKNDELYIRPMIWPDASSGLLMPDMQSINFSVTVVRMPMPDDYGFSACMSSYRRPPCDATIIDCKAAHNYPLGTKAMIEATNGGYQNAIMLDCNGNVAEFTSANMFAVIDGIVVTPVLNGTFLNGITRQTAIKLLSQLGYELEERTLHPDELDRATEIISTGNYGKIMFVNRFCQKQLGPGEVYKSLKNAYWEYSKAYMY